MIKSNKPVILVTNDDGITFPGIRALIEVMRMLGEVVVVAPDKPHSGTGHAITVKKPLRLNKVNIDGEPAEYSCSGTPVDCVKLAVNKVLHRKPDLCVSGINHGSNSSINVIYSGTMSAALEGAIEGIPSFGISLCNTSIDADLSVAKKYAKIVAENVLKYGLPKGSCLNVNIPPIEEKNIKGVKICRQANANWEEDFDERNDPNGEKYYWLTGVFKNYDDGDDTDEWALTNNYISIVPVQFDFTAHHAIPFINSWEFE
ncbi:MAG: 5'/3'-nucleotidase SurE [Bacteroidota bacterium]